MNTHNFKQTYSLETRKDNSAKVLHKYPDRVPVIIERIKSISTNVADLERTKYLVPYDTTIAFFAANIRKKVTLREGDSLFIFCGSKNHIVSGSNTFQHLYLNYKDEDGFLYLLYSGENVFG